MLYDIFSKITKQSKGKNKIKPRIIADIHEKNSLIISELKYSNEVELEIKHLEIGDYLIGDIAIERKTINDLISSIISKRILSQINNLQNYEKRLLIIEGDLKDLNENIKLNPKIIQGFILSCMLNHNINILQTKDYKDTSQYLITLAKQQLKPKTEISLHSRIPKTLKEQKKYILESFPNIGPKKAKKLLEKFSNLLSVFNASEEDLKEVLKNRAKEFKNLLYS